MTFYEVLAQVLNLLQREGRVSYRALKRQFDIDDAYIEDLKVEIIQAKKLAVDENDAVLVWAGAPTTVPALLETREQGPHASPPETPTDQEPAAISLQTAQLQVAPVDQAGQDETPLDTRRTPEAERRQLTVMFCDLVDSTPLSEQLDPEDLREVVQAYQQTCVAVIQRLDGYIAQLLGDALLVYFGWPRAHDDDAQRAVRAGLGILEAMGTLNSRLEQEKGIRLAIRVGIHTGLVVVGEMGGGDRQEQLAFGDTPNIAFRLQSIAVPDTMLISRDTYHLVRGHFTVEAMALQSLKGVAAPMQVYRVLEESTAKSRFEVAITRGLTPLLGREVQMGLLLRHWQQAKDGQGQAVMLSGEAGIGKSRLVQALTEHVERDGYTRIMLRASPYYQNSALYPVIDHLMQRWLRFRQKDSPEERLAKLERFIGTYSFPLQEVVPLLASLLSVPLADRYPPLNLSAQRQKQKTAEVLGGMLLEEAKRQAVLVVYEDLHWSDPSTLELLNRFMDQAPTARILTLLTFRPEFRPPWPTRSHMARITLGRLSCQQVGMMIETLTGGKSLPPEVTQQVAAKTDGVPLFVEELTKTVLESGLLKEEEGHYVRASGHAPLPMAIPATLHGSLMARLDRLVAAKRVAQLGATLGREFSYELIQAISSMDETTLQQGLSRLVEAELVYQRGLPPQAHYSFKHAMVQEVAYESLLKRTRQQYHQKIAQVLEARFAETAEIQPELVAHHYTEAGLRPEAIGYWQRAGQRAIQRSAHVEAIHHLTKGLELLQALPDTPERTQQELRLHIALGAPLTAIKGYAAPEVGRTYTRARELCRQVGETPQLIPVLFGLWRFYLQQGALHTARELGEQCLSLAQRVDDPVGLLRAHNTLGVTLFYLGELTAARQHLEQGIALYAPQQRRAHAFVQDPVVVCLAYTSWVLWYLGYADQALARSRDALSLVQTSSHPYSLAMASFFAAQLHCLRREWPATQARAEAAIALATEREFPFWLAQGLGLRGLALAEQGQRAEGIAQMQQGLVAYQATGAELGQPYYLTLPAEMYGQIGQAEEGLRLLDNALAQVHKSGERCNEPELYRLKGELLLRAEDGVQHAEATPEACFHKALEIARRQQAKAWELRAAMSLSRLWQRQGKHGQTYQVLAPIYGWFTEGFDTVDLKEAKALLEALSCSEGP